MLHYFLEFGYSQTLLFLFPSNNTKKYLISVEYLPACMHTGKCIIVPCGMERIPICTHSINGDRKNDCSLGNPKEISGDDGPFIISYIIVAFHSYQNSFKHTCSYYIVTMMIKASIEEAKVSMEYFSVCDDEKWAKALATTSQSKETFNTYIGIGIIDVLLYRSRTRSTSKKIIIPIIALWKMKFSLKGNSWLSLGSSWSSQKVLYHIIM